MVSIILLSGNSSSALNRMLALIKLSIISEMAKDCVWAQWGQYSKCSKSCGGGVQTRVRSKAVEAENGGLDCTGLAKQSKQCNEKSCSKFHYFSKRILLNLRH